MKNNFLNKSIENVYIKPSKNSELTTQILHGEKFKILKKKKIGSELKLIMTNIRVI